MDIFPSSFIFLFLIVTTSQAATRSCNAGDSKSLLLFKSSVTNDTKGTLRNWIPSTDCCKWAGIRCNRTTGRVSEIKLSNGELHGTVHESLGSLGYLRNLDLSYNHLTGSIPASLTNLARLELLDIAYNYGLTGSLPVDIGKMTNLVRIRLQSNKLTGTIPDSFGNLRSLVYCELDNNLLHGPVPDSFTHRTTSLALLDLSENKLTALPKELSNLKRLGILYLGSNPLDGFKSVEGIKTLPFLGELHLNNDGLAGAIPYWLATLNLRQSDDFLTCNLDLSGNLISGSIPPVLGNMTNLEGLQLQKNRLRGVIPKELLNLA